MTSPFPDLPHRVAGIDRPRCEILECYATSAKDCPFPDQHTWPDERLGRNPGSRPNRDSLRVKLKVRIVYVVGSCTEMRVLGRNRIGTYGDLRH